MACNPHTRFYYLKLLPISLTIIAALAIFLGLIWVGVGIGKFLIVLGVRNILDTKITWSGNILVSGWLSVLLHLYDGLSAVMD
jgi:hypothetical protein